MDSDLSEEMKMILALAKHLGLEIKATGRNLTEVDIDATIYGRETVDYAYTVATKE